MAAPYRGHGRGVDVMRVVRGILKNDRPLGDSLGIRDGDRQRLHAVAHDLYRQARYDLAQHLFAQLVLYDNKDPRYMKGLAAATQMLGQHEHAVHMYAVAALMDVNDPSVVMHAGDCFRAMGKPARAFDSFDLARSMCSRPEHQQIKLRCDQALAGLRQAA
ncbi:CesD/SycD/LcrH family type III secretion system chaperone [Bordetella genomosp. 9]|uniref:CesD/SycD/LcrH family type III secretion system chaperone n=1 Tax=Bordetella genomosp. 9 TaxID=1416803 RepID=A0A261R4T1_9BORD|nr:SycD/LcrH family type III secretion system chaperone [Bordetella genomosp. 9]OZI20028.1 CesD/SycD/LcrH family type III secretion system chaperone [Bordetella genomosp. 9]